MSHHPSLGCVSKVALEERKGKIAAGSVRKQNECADPIDSISKELTTTHCLECMVSYSCPKRFPMGEPHWIRKSADKMNAHSHVRLTQAQTSRGDPPGASGSANLQVPPDRRGEKPSTRWCWILTVILRPGTIYILVFENKYFKSQSVQTGLESCSDCCDHHHNDNGDVFSLSRPPTKLRALTVQRAHRGLGQKAAERDITQHAQTVHT